MSGTLWLYAENYTNNIDTYNNFITNVLANTPNIYQYHSSIVLNEIKRETPINLEKRTSTGYGKWEKFVKKNVLNPFRFKSFLIQLFPPSYLNFSKNFENSSLISSLQRFDASFVCMI